ncbi:MAG: aldo/keto reductase [Caulobacteraceae bacterium]
MVRAGKLGLGTAQFGLDYGQAGPRGRSPEAEAGDILQIAARGGVGVLDAAVGTGHAETVLGRQMPRPCPFRAVLKTARCDRGPEFVEKEVRASLTRLGLDRAYAIVVQQAGDLFGPYGPALWSLLQRLKGEGLVEKIGVSVYPSDDPRGLARRFHPDIIQAPASLLDQRLIADGTLSELAGQGIEVHLRSIFLQGILFLPPDRMPAHLRDASGALSKARRMMAEGRSDPLQAALGWALSRPEASSVIVGVTTAAEIQAVLAAAASPPPDLAWDDMAIDNAAALDGPAWRAA